MLSAEERWLIAQNIIARAGGLDKVDLQSELAKSLALYNSLKASRDLNGLAGQMGQTNLADQVNQSTPVGQTIQPRPTTEGNMILQV